MRRQQHGQRCRACRDDDPGATAAPWDLGFRPRLPTCPDTLHADALQHALRKQQEYQRICAKCGTDPAAVLPAQSLVRNYMPAHQQVVDGKWNIAEVAAK